MIARKIKPGILEIIDVQSEDELESYSLLEISDKDAYLLLASTKYFNREGNVTTITYENGDNTDKMFKAIAQKHKENNPTNFLDVSKKYTIDEDVMIPGTSVLLRDPKEHVIKVCRRTTTNSKIGNINRLFIDNATRDNFFFDVKHSTRFKNMNKYELDSTDKKYAYWSDYMNQQYCKIMRTIKESVGK